MADIQSGDILTYSAGSFSSDPDGFRIIGAESNFSLKDIAERWPKLVEALNGKPPLVINAYPAAIGNFEFGILVDSYLSSKIVFRSFQLACQRHLPVVLISQPLIAADLLAGYYATDSPKPSVLILVLGGYITPQSLEAFLLDLCQQPLSSVFILHAYGAAEIGAGGLIGMERNSTGDVLYFPRDADIKIEIENDRMFLTSTHRNKDTETVKFPTGDYAFFDGDSYIIRNDETRLCRNKFNFLESWGINEWRRFTGCIEYRGKWHIQLREGEDSTNPEELNFYDFGKQFGFSWLNKPKWF